MLLTFVIFLQTWTAGAGIALPVKLAAAFAVVLAAGWVTVAVMMGYSLFRNTSARLQDHEHHPNDGFSAAEREKKEEAERSRNRLLRMPHETLSMMHGGVELIGEYFPARSVDMPSPDGGHFNAHLPADPRRSGLAEESAEPAGELAAHGLSEESGAGKQDIRNFQGGCVLLVHGWRDYYLSRSADALEYLAAGFSVFMPALHGHAPSGGKYVDLFCLFSRDLLSWMEQLRERFGNQKDGGILYFVLDGISMGASNVLKLSGDSELPANVRAVIADCGYTSLSGEARWMLHKVPAFLRWPAMAMARVFYFFLAGYRTDKPAPIDRVRHARVPVFIIHGGDDTFVPTAMGRDFYEACSSRLKKLWIVPGAKHGTSVQAAGEEYYQTKFAFIADAVNDSSGGSVPA